MTTVKNPLLSLKSSIIYHIEKPVMRAAHSIFKILMTKSQVFNYIIFISIIISFSFLI